MQTKLLVSGSRTGIDYNTVARKLAIAISDLAKQGYTEIIVIHGDAEGVDTHAKEFVNKTEDTFKAHGIIVKQRPFPVKNKDWYIHTAACKHQKYSNGYCPEAALRRNKEMVDEGPSKMLAFIHNKSKGTTQCAQYAESKGIKPDYFRS